MGRPSSNVLAGTKAHTRSQPRVQHGAVTSPQQVISPINNESEPGTSSRKTADSGHAEYNDIPFQLGTVTEETQLVNMAARGCSNHTPEYTSVSRKKSKRQLPSDSDTESERDEPVVKHPRRKTGIERTPIQHNQTVTETTLTQEPQTHTPTEMPEDPWRASTDIIQQLIALNQELMRNIRGKPQERPEKTRQPFFHKKIPEFSGKTEDGQATSDLRGIR